MDILLRVSDALAADLTLEAKALHRSRNAHITWLLETRSGRPPEPGTEKRSYEPDPRGGGKTKGNKPLK